jgi:hypothetical protein
MGRGTERKLEKHPQGVEKRKERGGIGGDKWRGGRASKSPSREIRMKIVKSITSSDRPGL